MIDPRAQGYKSPCFSERPPASGWPRWAWVRLSRSSPVSSAAPPPPRLLRRLSLRGRGQCRGGLAFPPALPSSKYHRHGLPWQPAAWEMSSLLRNTGRGTTCAAPRSGLSANGTDSCTGRPARPAAPAARAWAWARRRAVLPRCERAGRSLGLRASLTSLGDAAQGAPR